jgi:hypothetical protein
LGERICGQEQALLFEKDGRIRGPERTPKATAALALATAASSNEN